LKYLEVGVIAFIVSYILTLYMARVGKKQNMVDIPGHRKIHEEAIPNLGGIVIFFGFLLSLLLVVPIEGQVKALLIGGVIILLLGVVDDIVNLSPKHKFIIQMIPALIVVVYSSDLINSFIVNQLKSLDLLGYLLYPIGLWSFPYCPSSFSYFRLKTKFRDSQSYINCPGGEHIGFFKI